VVLPEACHSYSRRSSLFIPQAFKKSLRTLKTVPVYSSKRLSWSEEYHPSISDIHRPFYRGGSDTTQNGRMSPLCSNGSRFNDQCLSALEDRKGLFPEMRLDTEMQLDVLADNGQNSCCPCAANVCLSCDYSPFRACMDGCVLLR